MRLPTLPLTALTALTALTTAVLLHAPMAAQAEVVKDLVPGVNGSAGDALVSYKGKVYFEASTPGIGSELYVATGPKSASLFKDLWPGRTGAFDNSGSPGGFCEFGGKLYFAATFAGVGRELAVSDGTASGTKLFKDVWSSGSSSSPWKLTVAGSRMYFFARTSSVTMGIFVTDGSPAGTKLLRNFGGQGVNDMGRMGTSSSVLFGAQGAGGVELWISDGTVLGTKLLKELRPGSAHSWPAYYAQLGAKTVFTATTTLGKRHLWISDGSALGTVPVGASVSVTSPLAVMGGHAWFEGDPGNGDQEIWRTDGTKALTQRVADVRRGIHGSAPDWLTPVAGRWLYFSAQVFDGRGRELWRTDGTEAGTLQVAEIYAGSNNSSPYGSTARRQYAVNGDYVYFYAFNRWVGRELFAVKTSAATSYKEGVGCGSKPTLRSSFPKLGKTLTVSGTRAPATSGILVFGIPAATPITLPGGCVLRIDFALPYLLTPVAAPASSWSVGVPVPSTSSWTGLILGVQAAFANGTAMDLTNGVRLMLGD